MAGGREQRPVVLVTSRLVHELMELRREVLEPFAELRAHHQLKPGELEDLRERVEVLLILDWPSFLRSREQLEAMPRLRLIQSVLAGVDAMPFGIIPPWVTVCSNAGGFSNAVAEHAWALILAAAKLLYSQHRALAQGTISSDAQAKFAESMKLLEGANFGVIGLGGIGLHAAKIAKAFGMRVLAITRSGSADFACDFVGDMGSLEKVLSASDVLLIAVPLTKATRGLIGKRELSLMKEDAILANVARGDIVDQQALYEHLRAHPNFVYVTDVFWLEDGKEALRPKFPFFELPNFLATPHTSGPLALRRGRALDHALENVLRYFRGEPLRNVVRREDYI
jgi:phosphoglycerate dehydrogenase-like enzyme